MTWLALCGETRRSGSGIWHIPFDGRGLGFGAASIFRPATSTKHAPARWRCFGGPAPPDFREAITFASTILSAPIHESCKMVARQHFCQGWLRKIPGVLTIRAAILPFIRVCRNTILMIFIPFVWVKSSMEDIRRSPSLATVRHPLSGLLATLSELTCLPIASQLLGAGIMGG
jgi:hypothetical protein